MDILANSETISKKKEKNPMQYDDVNEEGIRSIFSLPVLR